jgi:hypothetical protein
MATKWTQADIDAYNARQNQYQPVMIVEPIKKESSLKAYQALGRMKQGKMNETEKRYAGHLDLQKQSGDILEWWFEAMNLRLGDKCFYKVDFLVLTADHELQVHEVKGFWTDDALVKIKTAADKFPFRFVAIRWVKKAWDHRWF